MKLNTEMEENRKALVLTWKTNSQKDFWNEYEKDVQPTIKSLHQKGFVKQVFPFEHQPLSYQNSKHNWTNCIILMLAEQELNLAIESTIVSTIEKSSIKANFLSLDYMRLQQGLDMFYSKKNGISREPKMNQTIEYVFSKPEARKEYYEDQYKFSGPAMRDLHNRDKTGRFIGFELEKRIKTTENLPEWDLIHIIGFTVWQEIKAGPFFSSTWNKHAESAFGKGMTMKKKVAEWNQIRTNVKSSTKQNFSMTLREN